MELLKEKIRKEGRAEGKDIVKVDSFLNHQIDINFMNEIGKEFKRLFHDEKITKILTIEASGIAIASITAQYFNVPVLFAKKTLSRNLDSETYQTEVYSFTRGKTYSVRVSKKYLNKNDKVLILDDFLAEGKATLGLMDIVKQSGGETAGVGIVIEKGFQDGGKILREMGINLHSLVIIDSIENGTINFK